MSSASEVAIGAAKTVGEPYAIVARCQDLTRIPTRPAAEAVRGDLFRVREVSQLESCRDCFKICNSALILAPASNRP